MENMNFDKILKNFQNSERFKFIRFGEDYYNSRNTAIMSREKKVFIEALGGAQANPFAANHKLASGHFKKIAIQKVMYLLGKGVNFTEDGQNEAMDAYFDDTFNEVIIDCGLEAAKKASAWLLAFKRDNKLQFTLIPSEQLFPIYDDENHLTAMLRRFDSNGVQVLLHYDEESIQRYERSKKKGEFEFVSDMGHWTTKKIFNGQEVEEREEHGFGFVPFIPLFNNREHLSDLYPIKGFIDTYDIINSDFANNIDDMQDAFFTLKGYSGNSEDLATFMRELKSIKAVPVSDDGDIKAHQLTIPTEARKVFLELLQKDIYKFAMAVDLTGMNGGSGITNVYIKAMFADLDLKCDEFESQIRKFIGKIIDVINEFDSKNFTKEMNFERSMIMNRQEAIESLSKLQGVLSNVTIRELLPYDIDEDQEQERLNNENGGVTIGD